MYGVAIAVGTNQRTTVYGGAAQRLGHGGTTVYGVAQRRCTYNSVRSGTASVYGAAVYHGVYGRVYGVGSVTVPAPCKAVAMLTYTYCYSSLGLRLVFVGRVLLTLGPWPRVSQSSLPTNSPSATSSGVWPGLANLAKPCRPGPVS